MYLEQNLGKFPEYKKTVVLTEDTEFLDIEKAVAKMNFLNKCFISTFSWLKTAVLLKSVQILIPNTKRISLFNTITVKRSWKFKIYTKSQQTSQKYWDWRLDN